MPEEKDYIFGMRPVIEAIRSGRQIDKLLIKHGLKGSLYHELMAVVKENDVARQFVPPAKLDMITRKNHQGVLAWISVIEYQDIVNLLPVIYENGEDPLFVLLDNISDVRNFGAIARSAECMGAHAIIIPEKGSARISADAVRTSAGALNSLPVCREKNIVNTLGFLKDSGLKVVCASEKSGKLLPDTNIKGPLVLILGSEEKGIGDKLISLSDDTIRIPMSGTIASLNVSVAAGILLYEIIRQRRG
jgi:23S rRNA (guanosine2251-2'-O)-methyltransferase